MRRLKDLLSDMTADLGGEERLSTAEQMLVRRAAMLCLMTELYERHWARQWATQPFKIPALETLTNYGTTSNSLRRTLESLGLQRRPQDVTPMSSEDLRERLRERGITVLEGEAVSLLRPDHHNPIRKGSSGHGRS